MTSLTVLVLALLAANLLESLWLMRKHVHNVRPIMLSYVIITVAAVCATAIWIR